ncbi:hypothetical protein [Paenibacillus sp. UNC496MF]|uniref:hypothetical protein n=1 Tax=Paenibacillus sp. UNC496MF TaxID=1502753 RepID=UPI001C42F67C|nr:hypothetical protein [Paenibacillus sp. UNC496MF]
MTNASPIRSRRIFIIRAFSSSLQYRVVVLDDVAHLLHNLQMAGSVIVAASALVGPERGIQPFSIEGGLARIQEFLQHQVTIPLSQ